MSNGFNVYDDMPIIKNFKMVFVQSLLLLIALSVSHFAISNDSIKADLELIKKNIALISNLKQQPGLKGRVKFRYYIKPDGRLMVFKQDSDLPSELVAKLVKKLMLIEYPPMSETDFEVSYTMMFYPS